MKNINCCLNRKCVKLWATVSKPPIKFLPSTKSEISYSNRYCSRVVPDLFDTVDTIYFLSGSSEKWTKQKASGWAGGQVYPTSELGSSSHLCMCFWSFFLHFFWLVIRLDKSLHSVLHSNTDIPKERGGGAEGEGGKILSERLTCSTQPSQCWVHWLTQSYLTH